MLAMFFVFQFCFNCKGDVILKPFFDVQYLVLNRVLERCLGPICVEQLHAFEETVDRLTETCRRRCFSVPQVGTTYSKLCHLSSDTHATFRKEFCPWFQE